jgi:hypothetical protein
MKRCLIIATVFFAMFFTFVFNVVAGKMYQFSYHGQLLVSDSIGWFQDSNSATFGSLKIDEYGFHKKLLNSNFHSTKGASTFGSLIDFITALTKTGNFDKITMITANLEKITKPPHSIRVPLISGQCILEISFKPQDGKVRAYKFVFLYYSDSAALSKMATDNKFPNTDSMDEKTFLIALEELVTDTYPDNFVDMSPASFDSILLTPFKGVNLVEYVKVNK